MIIKISEVKEFVGDECRVSADFYAALDKSVQLLIKDAAKRARQNGRRTLKPCDL